MRLRVFSSFCKSLFICLLIGIIVLTSACAVYNRFKPNTMLKEFIVDGDKPKVGDYELTVLMQAKEVGNKVGIDNYRIVLQLKSDKAINSSDDSLALAIPRFDLLTITSEDETAFKLELGKENLSYRELTVRPQIFRNHYFEYFDIRNIVIPDEINRIRIDARAQLFNRQTLQSETVANLSVYLDKRQSIEWYDPVGSEQQNKLEGLESYRGTTDND